MYLKPILFFLLLPFVISAQNINQQIDKIIKENQSAYNDCYKQLHTNPELSTKEVNTAAYLKKAVASYGYQIIDSLGHQSFAAILKNGNGPVILYRTDMDGLPIKEQTSLPFASVAMGIKDNEPASIMHACGHDIHMTTWLGLAKVLSQLKSQWSGTIVLLAQSAEETAQGAKKVVVSENFKSVPKADYQLAIHDHAELSVGEVGFCDGFSMAAVDMLNITFYGKGGHGAAPQQCIDPILLSAQFITEIQSIISRNLSPNEPAIITVGAINGGTVGNIIPEQVKLKLTIRSFSKESRELILNRLKVIGDNLALAAGLEKDKMPYFDLLDMTIPSVYNNPELGSKLNAIIKKQFGDSSIVKMKPIMLGEDFGVYGQQETKIPSYILWMGTVNATRKKLANENKATLYSLHSAHFAPNYEEAIPAAIKIMSISIMELFKTKSK